MNEYINKENKFFSWIRRNISLNLTNKLALIVVLIYYYIGLLGYITASIPGFNGLFSYNSVLEITLRAITSIILVIYCFIVLVVYRHTPPWRYAILLLFVLVMSIFATAISPSTYKIISIDTYNTISLTYLNPTIEESTIMILSSISDFILGYCFLFILPLVINNKKQLLIILVPLIVIGIIEVIYSSIVDRHEYGKLLRLMDPEYWGYNIRIKASFSDKQNWGLFLSLAFSSSLFTIILIDSLKKKVKIVIRILLIILTLVFFAFTIMSLCKTAIVGEVLALIMCLICFAIYLLKRKKYKAGYIYISILGILLIGVILYYTVPILHSYGLAKSVYDFTTEYIFGNINSDSIMNRISIWARYAENLPSYNFYFGLGKKGSQIYATSFNGYSTTHNGIANIFAFYGIVGLVVYALLLVIVIINILKIHKINISYCYMLLGILMIALCFSILEPNTLILSGSNLVFIFNILLVSFPSGMILKERNRLIYEK